MVFLMPVMLAVLGGILDFMWYFAHQHALDAAVREGIFVGTATPQDGDPDADAETAAEARWDQFGLPGTVTWTITRTGTPQTLKVTGDVPFAALLSWDYLAPDHVFAGLEAQMEEQP